MINFDNASGVAVSMEPARVMASRSSAATILFAAVPARAQYGSARRAKVLKTAAVTCRVC
jgi:Zn-dependent M28 family amino/carboxypeptidase